MVQPVFHAYITKILHLSNAKSVLMDFLIIKMEFVNSARLVVQNALTQQIVCSIFQE